MWADEYVGIPYRAGGNASEGLDCWRLVCLVYRDLLGIDLPRFEDVAFTGEISATRKVWATIQAERNKWRQVVNPKAFDVILMRTGGRLPCHVGIAIDARNMLHIEENLRAIVEDFRGPIWYHRVEGFFRYER